MYFQYLAQSNSFMWRLIELCYTQLHTMHRCASFVIGQLEFSVYCFKIWMVNSSRCRLGEDNRILLTLQKLWARNKVYQAN